MTTKLALTSGGGALFPEDVFSTWTYSGTGATQNIQNGINLSGSGGMVWTKNTNTAPHWLCDTVRGANLMISPTTTYTGGSTNYANSITGFNANGYTLGSDSNGIVNGSGSQFISWAFRRAPKFFDVVTYTGNGAARTIPHSLSIAPGFILVKRTDSTGTMLAYHISAGAGNYLAVNDATGLTASSTVWNNTAPTSSVFSLGADANSNANGATYVAYLFAHDAASDGIVFCGSYTGNGSTAGPTVAVGWEPQFLLIKVNGGSDWKLLDSLRRMDRGASRIVEPSSTNSDGLWAAQINPIPTGFRIIGGMSGINTISTTHYYVAIRRPMKRPTLGTQVFAPTSFTGTGALVTVSSGFAPDTVIGRRTNAINGSAWYDRLRGADWGHSPSSAAVPIYSNSDNSEDLASLRLPSGYQIGATQLNWSLNTSGQPQIAYALKRAVGFFETVTYTGTGAAQNVSHGLGVVPELIIVKNTANIASWAVYHADLGSTKYAFLNSSAIPVTSSSWWNNTNPTATQFTVNTDSSVNQNGQSHIAYLFASRSGVSKVGSYTGNGTSQTINCGFATGARFVMVKRTDALGSATTNMSNGWNVADTARGISGGSEPTWAPNTTAADLSVNWLTADSSGFTVVQDANNDMNVNGATYIFFAVS